jgi:serine/threonine protein kinase
MTNSFREFRTLSRVTCGFSKANLLGRGRYGSVYRCTLEEEDEGAAATVAVKVFNLQQSGSSKSFKAECETLRRVRHRCLLKIVTCCSSAGPQGEEFKALVFEFMANGSLDDWIHPRSSNPTAENTLNLSERLGIAADIFDALDYLHNHSHPSIVHSDLKPSNVLLADDMSAKNWRFWNIKNPTFRYSSKSYAKFRKLNWNKRFHRLYRAR